MPDLIKVIIVEWHKADGGGGTLPSSLIMIILMARRRQWRRGTPYLLEK
jgi:hypothetical protein